jgi:hypothetical protein
MVLHHRPPFPRPAGGAARTVRAFDLRKHRSRGIDGAAERRKEELVSERDKDDAARAAQRQEDGPVIDRLVGEPGEAAIERRRHFGKRRGKVLQDAVDKGGEPGKSNLPDF